MIITLILATGLGAWGWLAWFGIVLVSFGVFEYLGLRRKQDGAIPLTQAIQEFTGKKGWKRDLGVAALVGFTGWFIFHLWI